MANTVPFLILGAMIMLQGMRLFFFVSAIVVLGSGLLVWLLGRYGRHAGLSSAIFGYFGFLVANAWVTREPVAVGIAVAALLIYGGSILGLRPGSDQVSWEGHVFGLVAGAGAAWIVRWVGEIGMFDLALPFFQP
jgi:membrane associated rhomboid family serine protease